MNIYKKSMIITYLLLVAYSLSFIMADSATYSWLTTASQASGEIVHATTEDLIAIESGLPWCENRDTINVKISITNQSKTDIPIQLDERKRNLSPGETY